jgi:hypothetical protein
MELKSRFVFWEGLPLNESGFLCARSSRNRLALSRANRPLKDSKPIQILIGQGSADLLKIVVVLRTQPRTNSISAWRTTSKCSVCLRRR